MNNLEYLNHISQTGHSHSIIQPAAPKSHASLIIKIVLGVVLALTLFSILGNVISDLSSRTFEQTKQLYLRVNNLNNTLDEYTDVLKSSKLRSIGFSLMSTLSASSNQLTNFLNTEYADKDDNLTPKPELAEPELELINNLNQSLRNAKLNGLLDRIYVSDIKYQVSLLLNMIANLIAKSDNQTLTSILTQLQNNLNVIQTSFDDYSNPAV